jgi:hypothetical protein
VTKFVNDQRVTVEISDPAGWNTDVLSVLQGKDGKIGAVKTHHWNGRESVLLAKVRYLVLFDTPTEATVRGVAHSGFWFDEDELREDPDHPLSSKPT